MMLDARPRAPTFTKLTHNTDHRAIWIDFGHVLYLVQSREGLTYVYFANDKFVVVDESPEQIRGLLYVG